MISQTAGHSDHRSAGDPSRLIDPTSRSHLEELGMTVVADGRSKVLQAAQDWGTYVAAHAYNSDGIRRTIDNGVRSIEHANLVDRETLKYMKEKGARLSPQVLVFKSEIRGLTPDQQAKQRQALDGVDQLMTMAREVGLENIVFDADVVTNLDALAGIGEELTLRTRWFKPAEILRQATSKAGELLLALSGPRNPYGTLGVIRQGAVADILLVDGDPLEDISVLANPFQNLRLIMKDGKIYKNTL